MALPAREIDSVGQFSFPATPQDGDTSAYTEQSNNDAIEAYINSLLEALQADMKAVFDAVDQEHP